MCVYIKSFKELYLGDTVLHFSCKHLSNMLSPSRYFQYSLACFDCFRHPGVKADELKSKIRLLDLALNVNQCDGLKSINEDLTSSFG